MTTASKARTPAAKKEAQEFATLLETRARLKAPAWWMRVFGERFSFGGPDEFERVKVTRDGTDVLITARDCRVRISDPPFKTPDEDDMIRACVVGLDSNRAYVGMLPIDGSLFSLNCVDLKTGHVVWKSDVWALGFENVSGWAGPISHNGEIKVIGDTVEVWGTGVGGNYIETFDANTGQNKLRFCTGNWFWNQ